MEIKEDNEEILPVVDISGKVIGSASRKECHSGMKILHPVVHLHVFNRKGEILCQHRTLTKLVQPGKWDTAVGGHVVFGESIHKALCREAYEELGMDSFEYKPLFLYVFESEIEREFVNSFFAVYEKEIHFDKTEITEVRFFSMRKIEENLGKNFFTPNFELEYMKIKESIKR